MDSLLVLSSKVKLSSWTALPLKMKPLVCPETSVTNYQSMLRCISEQRRPQLIGYELSWTSYITRHTSFSIIRLFWRGVGGRGNSVVCLTCIKTSLKNVKLLTADILYLIIIIIIIYCNNNFTGKYWSIFGPKFSGPPVKPVYWWSTVYRCGC
jgi:hypothetical protein